MAALLVDRLETDLIMNHQQQVQQLEVRYMQRINELMQQKNNLLMALQKEFLKKRNYIKQSISKAVNEDHVNALCTMTTELQAMDVPNLKVPSNAINGHHKSQSVNLSSLTDLTSVINNQQPPQEPVIYQNGTGYDCQENVLEIFETTTNQQSLSSNDHQCGYSANQNDANLNGGQYDERNELDTGNAGIGFVDKQLQCQLLGRHFASRTNLDDHIKQMLALKVHKCSVCHQTFEKKHQLIAHSRIHFGAKMYGCNGCNKRFYDQNTLKHHIAMVHD